MCRLFAVICSMLLVWPAMAQERADKPPPKPQTCTVPMELLLTKHIAIQIKVNGKGPYRVIFDTGSPVTLLSNKIAKEAELISKEDANRPTLFGARGIGKAKTVQICDIVIEDMPVMVMDHPALKAASRVLGPLDGIVGFPFFSRYRATFDYEAQQMTFETVEYRGAGSDLTEMLMALMMERNPKPTRKVQSPGAVWGFQVSKDKSDTEPGIDVETVLASSAAAEAGLKPGDRLLELDGTWTESVEDCFRAAEGVSAGQAVQMKIRRGGKEMALTITPRHGL
jgi:hypothetical protein